MAARFGWILILMVLASSLTSCLITREPAGVPEWARARQIGKVGDPLGEPTRYRTLTRDDFRAASPPPEVAQHASKMGAFTCVGFPAKVVARIDVTRDDARREFVASAADPEFFALMDRACSWWNEARQPIPASYILEHEQIHFMIGEIEARKALAKVRGSQGRADTELEARLSLMEQMDAAVRGAIQGMFAETDRFDDDTSAQHSPRAQARWRSHAEAELARLPASAFIPARADDDADAGPALEPL